ncbi:hypothetical protein [Streptomyces sp. NBC_01716]|uniref:hypothetical protein n=1 Tax=Streptomyces sp. NBC_01716 TaxID=2975917 RepID=UPI002E37DFB8|nr:hypothetical protein [Streptomyces sp. NBC_01716]
MGPDQEFKNELDRLIDHQLLPEGRDFVWTYDRAYRDTAEAVLDSFARPGAAARRFDLPEISATRRFPAGVAVGFHFLDHAVHSWDVARAVGIDWRPDDDIAEAALALARLVPDDGRRLAPGAAFSPARTRGARARHPFDLVLLTLGRSPGWTPWGVPSDAEWGV